MAGGRLGSVLQTVPSAASRAWADSLLAAELEVLRAVDIWRWLRYLGTALLAGALLALALGRAGGQAWPSLFAWGTMVACALALIVGPRTLAAALEDKQASVPELT